VEGGWTTARVADRYSKVPPLDERRRAPSPFTAPSAARLGVESARQKSRRHRRKAHQRGGASQQTRVNIQSVARMGFEPMTSSLKGIAASALC
jgi:hypothetical protein